MQNKYKLMGSRLFILLPFVLLAACNANEQQAEPDLAGQEIITPVKSPNDRREYRALVLDNQMKVLLISDPESETAAASVDVDSGYNADPDNFQGLAHFLEHMLFLGTDKYPEPGEYQEFISSRGGSHNAYTAYENTNYFFDIEAASLEAALDRFSRFFVAPLFNEAYVEREKNAVNSEYQANLQNDGRRANSVWKQVINQDHPIAQFSTGSLNTLTDREDITLREALLRHYAENYSANVMTLAILGQESLDELERMAREYFTEVPNNAVASPATTEPLFLPGQLPALVEYEPFRDSRSLSYSFPIPVHIERYREKPTAYLGNLIGHEGEGSLLSLLRDRGWANGLSAGGGLSYEDNATFSVNISLTEEGQQRIDEISQLLFQFIELVRQDGIQQWLFEEQQMMAQLGFAFQEPAGAVSAVSTLSRRMQEYPLEEIHTAPYAYEEFNPDFLNQILDALRPDNVLLTFTSQLVEPEQFDPWYNAGYRYSAIPQARVASWNAGQIDPALAIAEPNPFLPEDISLKATETRDLSELSVEEIVEKPELILDEDGIRLWFSQDNIYRQPRATFFLYAMTPLFSDSLENTILSSLAIRLLNDKLNEYEYPANLAGVYYQVSRRSRGFTLTLGGYDDKQDILLSEVLETLEEADFAEERFDIIRTEMIRTLQNADLQNPYVRAYGEVQNLLSNPYWSDEERLAALEQISFAEVQAFIPRMMENLTFDALYHGNVTEEDALNLIAEIRQYLQVSPQAEAPPFGTVIDLPDPQRIVLELEVEHDDSAVVVYIQAPDDTLESRAIFSMLGTAIRSPFFEELRTERQLGYIVNAGAMSLMDVSGLVMYIQSPVADPATLEAHIADFVRQYAMVLNEMPQEEFDMIKAGLLTNLREKPQRLGSLSSRFWGDILEQNLQTDSRLQLADAIAAVNKEDVLTFYQDYVNSDTYGELVSRSFGRNHALEYEQAQENYAEGTRVLEETAESYRAFKESQAVYEFRTGIN
ncbi:MAG: peptidase M16 [Gammaproteobacteria bacterium]|nr:peptidase M16 [Gammaproteobacteria bacterium]|tara:strand:+ start:284367 stop:287342 length:2976 start_codon:yes stop_codon:yes gene_type:complete